MATPLRVTRGEAGLSPSQIVFALTGGLDPALGPLGSERRVETTLDGSLMSELESLAKSTMRRLAGKRASSAAVVVIDNASGDVLAYLGSPDFFDHESLGQNDGVRAERQPGSTLKPFLYAAAMSELGLTPASLLPDLSLSLPTDQGTFSPKNYDRKQHGPVRVREALASSFNLPAVALVNRLGVERSLRALERFGFDTLDRAPEHYGVALALGDGEVRLLDLGRAYAAVARGGLMLRERFVRAVTDARGVRREVPPGSPERVIDARVAALVTDILSDPGARAPGFGRGSALELPFPVAVKTGTSKGYRDNFAVGFTREVTVAVWVGNFDGSPMLRSSGASGAAPLFHDVMIAAMRARMPAPLMSHDGLVRAEICALSGERPGEHCEHRLAELFVPGSEPHGTCTMHERVVVDAREGGRSAPGCPDAEARTFERYPAEYAAWARAAGRKLSPSAPSPRCPRAEPGRAELGTLSIEYPREGTELVLDPLLARQEIVLAARAPADARVRYVIDGREIGVVGAPFRIPWVLERGSHELVAEVAGALPARVAFVVQ
jgi:penicillin-binding protein 1C